MIYKKKTSLWRRLFALALVPAIGAGITVTSMPAVAGVPESLSSISTTASSDSCMVATNDVDPDNKVYDSVEEPAEFPGGMPGLMQFLSKTIRYPENAFKNNIQGRVLVKYIIQKDGTVTDAEVISSVDPELDAEAIRVVNAMPKWFPGKSNGAAVKSYFTIPINFRLQVK